MNVGAAKRLLFLSGIVTLLGALCLTLLVGAYTIISVVDHQITHDLSIILFFFAVCLGLIWVVVSLCFGLLTALKTLETLLEESQSAALSQDETAPEEE